MAIEHGLPAGPPRAGGRPAVLTIGNFDGVHRGHRVIVDAVVEAARELGGEAVVVTFDPHPRCVLSPGHCPPTLTTVDAKARLLDAAGVDVLRVLAFDLEMSRWSATEFCDRLLASHPLRRLIVGHDFAFGHNREGDGGFLRRYGEAHGFDVVTVEPLLDGEAPVSSTRIREALGNGDVATAAELLGRPYALIGTVEAGEGMGRNLGFPTANLEIAPGVALPAVGIYACWTEVAGGWHQTATSIGTRPTFGGTHVVVEPHLLDFDGDLYGARLRCAFVARLRDERTFPDAATLADQIARDVEVTRELLAGASPPG